MKYLPKSLGSNSGFILPMLLSFIVAALIFTGAAVEIINSNLTTVNTNVQSQQAFNIAEAGLNYYLWHLSHNSTDYKDGQSTPVTPDPTLGYGPYVHQYLDANAVNEGTYTLWINPQGGGSTIVNVRSIGQVKGTNIIRTVQAQIGAASFASYGVVSDSALWFGNDETAAGPVDSNQGIRLDGANTDVASSANASYVPSSSVGGDGNSHPGVWCSSTVTSPVNCNTRPKTNWQYPVPTVNFNQVSTSLCTMKKTAFANDSSTSSLANLANACSQTPSTRTAAYIPQRSSSFSLTKGYLIMLNTNNTYNLYNVNSENDQLRPYTSALGLQLVASNIAVPSSDVIFVEDNVWVLSNPTYHGRVTIASGRLATSNNTDIVIAGNLLYSTKNGSDAIGLVAENSIFIAPYAPPSSGSFNYEVDGALLAEAGAVTYGENGDGANNQAGYRVNTGRCTYGWTNANQTFTFYGSVATRQTWTWNWEVGGPCGDAVSDPVNGYISGIENTNTQYDYNLLYNPPPSFPITSSYNILSWREVLTHP